MIVVKTNTLQFFTRPIHLKLFGKNKTYRGLIVMPFFCLIGVYLAKSLNHLLPIIHQFPFDSQGVIGLGFLLGVSYIFFELPNSFIKRRIGVPEGKPSPKFRLLFFILDRVDSGTGCALVYHFYYKLSLLDSFSAVGVGIFVHFVVVYFLFLLKVRKEPY